MAADASVPASKLQPTLRPKVGRVKDLLGGTHGPGSPMFHALAQNTPDYMYHYDDFQQLTITAVVLAADMRYGWTYAETAGTPDDPSKLAPSITAPSCLLLNSTAASGYLHNLQGPKMYTPDMNPFFEVRLRETQVTDFVLGVGFANALPASSAVLSDIDTPTFATAADGAMYWIDTSQTLTTAALVVKGTTASAGAATKVVVSPTAAPFGVPTAAAFTIIRIELQGNGQDLGPSVARLFINDALVATSTVGPDSEKLLLPFIFSGAPTGGSSTNVACAVDYVRVGAQKPLSPF